MGAAMVERLLLQMPVTIYNRSPEKLLPLQQSGAQVAASVPDLLQQSEVILLMLSDAATIRSLLLSQSAMVSLPQRTIIQMGTISPSESRSLQQAIQAAGGQYLEAPVLGSLPEARAGKLLIMVGSTPEQFQRWLPVLQQLGPEPRSIGEVGTAAALKLSLNQLIAGLTTSFALSLSFVRQQGVSVEAFMEILRQSALYAPTFDKKLDRMLDQNYANPNFPTKHLLKDTRLFLTEAETLGLQVDSLAGVRQILEVACAAGLADSDYSALFAAVSSAHHHPTQAAIQIEHQPNAERLQQLDVSSWPIWQKEVSEFPWTYDDQETCYFLTGQVIVTPADGEPVSMGQGDLVTFPSGLSCTWQIQQPVKKHYRFGA